MRIKSLACLLLASVATLSFFSCINDDYDLSDVDTTVGVKVNDLTIPLNLDEVTLKSVLDLGDDSQIKEINGEYAVVENGEFSSEQIDIPSFTIKAPVIEPIKEVLPSFLHITEDDIMSWVGASGAKKINVEIMGVEKEVEIDDELKLISFDIKNAKTEFKIEADDIDKAIVNIDTIGAVAKIRISLGFDGLENFVDAFELENLVVQLPKGLNATVSDGGKYDIESGRLSFERLVSDKGMEADIEIAISDIYSDKAGAKLENGYFSFENELWAEGTLAVYARNLKDNVNILDLIKVESVAYKCALTFPDGNIKITTFTGDIQYEVDGINVDPVSMKDIPDLLSQSGTDVKLVNPQIYVELNNPVYEDYKVYATTSLELVPNPNATGDQFKVDVKVDAPMNQFCMSPNKPDNYYKNQGNGLLDVDFTNAEYLPFTNLGNILSGDGLPESIDINVVDPKIPAQHVKDFELGQKLGAVKGTYVFYAPLALAEGSKIKYTDTFDEWNDADIDAIEISKVKVNADMDSDIPFELEVKAFPIDKAGNKIMDNGKVVEGKAYMIDANGNPMDVIPAKANGPIVIEIEGTVRHLDGIILDAEIHGKDAATSQGNALKPGQHIKLNNLRIQVSGEYVKEL